MTEPVWAYEVLSAGGAWVAEEKSGAPPDCNAFIIRNLRRVGVDGEQADAAATEPTVEIHIPSHIARAKSDKLVDAVCRAITKHDIEFTRVKLVHPKPGADSRQCSAVRPDGARLIAASKKPEEAK